MSLRMSPASVNVAFGRQPLGRRRQLTVGCAAAHDTFSRADAALHANAVAVLGGNLDVSPGEAFAPNLNDDVRPAGLDEDGLLRNGQHPRAVVFVKERRPHLTDEQL